MKKAKVGKLLMDKNNNTPVVELDVEGVNKKVYIWIGACEAWALAMSMEGFSLERPMTHDLLISVVEALQGKVEHVVIHSIKDGTFLSNLVIKKYVRNPEGEGEFREHFIEIDSRPSDCIVIANKLNVPIYVTSEILLEAGISDSVSVNKKVQEDREKQEFNSFLDNLNIDELRDYMKQNDPSSETDDDEEDGE
ncbi:MAG TPA: bifunctional nuclease family protein [Thermotogota bacterium]|nr:bifunctional nuclease family protein [Thermotogota bacterium]HPJ87931.1 bifunctional nuclease family protein [Thermotogota bacterium]HPR95024.1 bifunctional nuclease family protein [Thermotogota bacterium]